MKSRIFISDKIAFRETAITSVKDQKSKMSQNSTKCELQISSKLLKKILARAFNSEVKTPEQLQSSKLLLLKQAQNRDMYRAQKLSRDWRENFQRLRKKEKTSIRQDLNPQPPNYEACALPLCYNRCPKGLSEEL